MESDAKRADRRFIVEPNRAIVAQACVAQSAVRWAQANGRPCNLDGHRVRVALRYSVEPTAAGDGVRIRNRLLAAVSAVAGSRCLATYPRSIAGGIARAWPSRSGASHRRQFVGTSDVRWKKTGPSPVDRRKFGSKHHIITEQKGIPLAAILTGANTNDVTQTLPLIQAIPSIAGKRGRPIRKPKILQGDRGYDSEPLRAVLRYHSIRPELAKRRTAHGSGLGRTRWVVERTIAWLHSFRRLKMRYEKLAVPHEAFLSLACSLICWNFLKPLL